jgi:hypothetical protein
MDRPDYILDLSSVPRPASKAGDPADTSASARQARPWLAIYWKCCRVYSRIYRDRRGHAYEGRCPSCARAVQVPIGPGGTSARFFEAQ